MLPSVFGMAAMSADGKLVTFSTEVPLLPIDGDASQFRTYLYDVNEDALTEIPLTSPASPASDPVPNADASVVVFTAASAGIQEEAEPATPKYLRLGTSHRRSDTTFPVVRRRV